MHQRKTNRLQQYNYSQPGYYFVTQCVQDRTCCLGEVVDGEMVLSECGQIVQRQWRWLAEHFSYVKVDEFQVMPNHLHGIIVIAPVGNGQDGALVGDSRDRPVQKPLPDLVGAFKTTSSKLIHNAGFLYFSWHRAFYDHVIRQDESLDTIREYIRNNPKQWELDEENPINFIHV